jgi:hypothetical protein
MIGVIGVDGVSGIIRLSASHPLSYLSVYPIHIR